MGITVIHCLLIFFSHYVGNIGYDPSDPSYHNSSRCTSTHRLLPSYGTYNGTCIHLLKYELTMPETVGILTASEIIQILSFFCFIFHLSRVTNTIKAERERLLCSVSDYSVIVKQIPKDTTKEELIHYFNALYPLNEKDWSGRPPVGTYVSFFFSIYRFIYLSIALLRLPSVHLTHYFSIYASLSLSLSPSLTLHIVSTHSFISSFYLTLTYLILFYLMHSY